MSYELSSYKVDAYCLDEEGNQQLCVFRLEASDHGVALKVANSLIPFAVDLYVYEDTP